ncbi:MAG: GNAT family N-acetyltransferase [Myxococcota bacterium]
MFEIRSAATLTAQELAHAFTRGFEGYAVPVRFGTREWSEFVRVMSVDIDTSVVALEGEVPVGILAIGIRGDEARIAGMGVVPERRHQGLGRQMLAHGLTTTNARSPTRVVLEVIDQNAAARELYRSFGFREARRLVGWDRPATPTHCAESTCVVPIRELARAAFRLEGSRLPWPVAPESLGMMAPPMQARALGDDSAHALVRLPEEGPARLTTVVATCVDRATTLLRALCAESPPRAWTCPPNLPEGYLSDAFDAAGFVPGAVTQYEMVLECA